MTLQDMKKEKESRGYSYGMIAEKTGIPLSTIQKLFSGHTKSPRYDTLLALEKFFNESKEGNDSSAGAVADSSAAYELYKKQGEYTLEDYYEIPDDQRVELIDGVIYAMSAPTAMHQVIAGEVHRQISNYIMGKNGDCIPFISPIDVQLDRDNKTMVQPDVIIVCKRGVANKKNIYGAPDWVMEVLSPSTKRKDSIKKLNKYLDAGVREYWLVDPESRSVTVYDFEHDIFPVCYNFEDAIPVSIYNGELKIELTPILKYFDIVEG